MAVVVVVSGIENLEREREKNNTKRVNARRSRASSRAMLFTVKTLSARIGA